MGMKLTFNLLRPEEALAIKKLIQQQEGEKQLALQNEIEDGPPPPKMVKAIENTLTSNMDEQNHTEPPLHALDPRNKNILHLESAPVPCTSPVQNNYENAQNTPLDLDLIQVVSETDDDQLIMAATQMESNYNNANMTTKTNMIAKKNSPNKKTAPNSRFLQLHLDPSAHLIFTFIKIKLMGIQQKDV